MMTEPVFSDTPCFGVALAVCWFINIIVVARLWMVKRADPFGRKLLWSLILVVLPILGLVFYAGFYRPPKPQNLGHKHSIIG